MFAQWRNVNWLDAMVLTPAVRYTPIRKGVRMAGFLLAVAQIAAGVIVAVLVLHALRIAF